MSVKAQKALIADSGLSNQRKLIDLMMAHRRSLWEHGSPKDIKRGNYFACYRTVDAEDNPDIDHFDRVSVAAREDGGVGWTKGLEVNITFKAKKGPYILVMDNHNFAAPFIFDMLDRKVISFDNKFMHVDRHADLSRSDNFRFADFLSLKSDRERFLYVLQTTNVANWTYPLIKSSIITEGSHSWMRVHEDGRDTWTKNIVAEDNTVIISEHKLLERHDEQKDSEIVDIDIDFLEHMDFMLSKEEKKRVIMGEIPRHISFKLSELVPYIADSKVTTIALSPGYIEQNRALMYVRHLLEMLGEVQPYA